MKNLDNGYYKPSDIRKDGLLKIKKLKERDSVRKQYVYYASGFESKSGIWSKSDKLFLTRASAQKELDSLLKKKILREACSQVTSVRIYP